MSIETPICHAVLVDCQECGESISEKLEIVNLEWESSDERGMGEETQYSFTCEVQCPHCNHDFTVDGEVWEYPVGAINLIQLT